MSLISPAALQTPPASACDPVLPELEAAGCEFLRREAQGISVRVDLSVYSQDAVLRVIHRFTGLAFVHMEREPPAESSGAGRLRVHLVGKQPEADLRSLAGEFLNELLDQTLRERVGRETEGVRNLILAHALSEVTLLHPELESAEPAEDPAGVGRADEVRR